MGIYKPSEKSYGYDPMPRHRGTADQPRCVVCLARDATRWLRDYFKSGVGKDKDNQSVAMCSECEPGRPCAAYRAGRGT